MDNISKVKARKLIEPKYKVLQNYTDNQKKTLNGSRENYLSFMKKSPGRESQGNNEEFKAQTVKNLRKDIDRKVRQRKEREKSWVMRRKVQTQLGFDESIYKLWKIIVRMNSWNKIFHLQILKILRSGNKGQKIKALLSAIFLILLGVFRYISKLIYINN